MAISNPSHELPSLETRPDPDRPRPRGRGWVWFLIFVLLAGGGYYYYTHMRTQNTEAADGAAPGPGGPGGGRGGRGRGLAGAVPVAVTTALQQDVPYYLPCLGTVTAFNTVTVKTRVDGELQNVYFTEGQFVKAGDVLAQIDPRPYDAALEQADGQLARDQANLVDAQKDQGRYDMLLKEGVIAQQQVDTQVSTVGQLEGAIRTDQANIDSQKLNITYAKIVAPISGRVGLRLVDQGNFVTSASGTGLVVITQVQPISVIFIVPEDNLPDVVKHFNEGTLAVVAYSRDDQTELARGKLASIDNQIDPTTGTVKLKAVFDNENLALWPNQFVNIRLMLDVRKNAIVVPSAAVESGDRGAYLYTVGKNNTAELRQVKVDVTQGNISLIASGVMPGDEVVVDGQDKLQAGAPVIPHEASATSAGTAGTHSSAGATGDDAGPRPNGPRGGPGNGRGPRGDRSGEGPAAGANGGAPHHKRDGGSQSGPTS